MAQLVLSQPSIHRRLLLKVSKQLSKEDVKEIAFLSEDFLPPSEVAGISSGVDLMRELERHGRLGPGNYHYLLSCLEDVGRLDLAELLLLESPSQIPYVPQSFTATCQMQQTNMAILGHKLSIYTLHMQQLKALSQDQPFWERAWTEIFSTLCQSFDTGGHCSFVPKSADVKQIFAATLEDALTALKYLTSGLVALKGIADIPVAKGFFTEVIKAFEKLNSKLESINWKTQQCCKPLAHAHMASEACSYLGGFLSDLLGGQTHSEAKSLSEGLGMIESMTNIAQHGLAMLQWLFTATEVVLASTIDIQSCMSQVSGILAHLTKMDILKVNRELFLRILGNTELAKDLHDISVPSQDYSLPMTILQNCPILVTLCLTTYVLDHSHLLMPGDWGKIKAKYRLEEKSFAQMYSVAAGGLFQIMCSVVECFKQSTLSVASMQDPNLQQVVTQLLTF